MEMTLISEEEKHIFSHLDFSDIPNFLEITFKDLEFFLPKIYQTVKLTSL